MSEKKPKHFIAPSPYLRRFLVLFFPLSALFSLLVFFFYHHESANRLELVANKEKVVVGTGLRLIHDTLDPILADLGFLADFCGNSLGSIDGALEDQTVIKRLEREFQLFAANHPEYDQIRFLDANGMERIRINSGLDKPVIVQANALQDKAERYYFRDTIHLNKGEIFISPLDLNIEYQKIEFPLKPMIRLGEVVVDTERRKIGIIIVNYKAREMLDKIHNWAVTQTGDLMLLNSDGYWLHGKTPEQEWGF